MKFPNLMKTVLVILGIAIFAPAMRAQDPADDFLKAYFLLQDGDTAKKSNEKDKAIEKYNGALDVLRKIQLENPDWNPNIINFRIKYCTENVTALGGTPSTGASAARSTGSEATTTTGPTTVAVEESGAKLTELQNELKQTRQQLEQIRKEKDDLQAKLQSVEESLKSVTAGKGDARLVELQKANDDLRQKLTDAEERLKGVSGEGASAQLQQELAETKKQLDAALQENEKLRKDNETLRAGLDEARTKLKALASSDDTIKTMQRENALLRAIVERAYQEDAKRIDQKNQIKTDLADQQARVSALEQQIAALATPLTPLSSEERELLKSPSIVIRDQDKSEGPSVEMASGTTEDAKKPLSGQNADLAKSARESYEKGDFDGAADKYEAILKTEANNIFALSNLGVIRFRQEKLGEAETLLNKALDIDPTDAFSRSVLGIIYYKQGSFDEAISELTRSIALDGKAAEPHNYLGITYSQKGYQEAAEKELLKAVELSPNYGDAHFNLAVVYATQNPPALTLAKKHYKRALELNVPPDTELEKLFSKQ